MALPVPNTKPLFIERSSPNINQINPDNDYYNNTNQNNIVHTQNLDNQRINIFNQNSNLSMINKGMLLNEITFNQNNKNIIPNNNNKNNTKMKKE